MAEGTVWATVDETRLATSSTLWPAVNPSLTEEQKANYGHILDIKNVYKEFWWMGDSEDITSTGAIANRKERLKWVGTGTL